MEKNQNPQLLLNNIENELQQINRHRKKYFSFTICLIIIILISYWIIISLANPAGFFSFNNLVNFHSGFLGVIAGCIGLYYILHKKQAMLPKRKVVEVLLKDILPGSEFHPKGFIDISQFISSEIFNQTVDYYEGEDLIVGKHNSIHYQFSQLWVQCRNAQNHPATLFKGIFAILRTERYVNGKVVVLPDTMPRYQDRKTTLSYQKKLCKDLQLIEVPDREFEREFVVYANDPKAVTTALTSPIRKFLLALRTQTHCRIYASFVGDKIHIGMRTGKDILDTPFSKNITASNVEQYARTLLQFHDILHALELHYLQPYSALVVE